MMTRSFLMLLLLSYLVTTANAQTIPYAPPKFAGSDRLENLQAVFPEVDRVFRDLAEEKKLPGLVYGIIFDGKLVHTGEVGFANLELKTPATADTAFRIASMTKSFVTLSIFKLRDDGKLRLDDPVKKYLPEFRNVRPPTKDSPEITIRHLMSMSSGLPEDNPWGDRQMAITKEALRDFVSGGLSFSNPPGQQYEYSNLGFVLLGQIVSKASKMPFQKYITENILRPLGMLHTGWEYTHYPADQFALGYRWEHEAWKPEPILHDGEGAACGGLITTLNDFAKYVEIHLDAWPARDEPENGPVRRATLRDLQKPQILTGMSPNSGISDGKGSNPEVSFYGYGLGWTVDGRGIIRIGHSGGLPGYGSNYRFLPDLNLAVIAFANRTYAPAHLGVTKALSILVERGHLHPRETSVSPILETRKAQVGEWIVSWDEKLGQEIAAENFFLDKSREDWMKLAHETLAKAGAINSIGPMKPLNQLRGSFPMQGSNGTVNVWFTLTPEKNPKVQELTLSFTPKE
jgi:CubicO group peptidase (beta-lactamase class C family)